MTADSWRQTIGRPLFDHLVGVAGDDNQPIEDRIAAVLSVATEMGFTAPVQAPRVDPAGTKTLWPREDGRGVVPVLTTEGLLRYYEDKGHSWFLLRMPQMLRGHRGPLAARLQETLALYEAQCRAEGVEPLPDYADCRLFVGGSQPAPRTALVNYLTAEKHGAQD
tara:strand:+ start:145 stop:639 length:495 start_codon:yes stop_codon:yes gene_type:complete